MSAPEGRMYRDIDGNECTLHELCRKEPEWAANVITTLRAIALKASRMEFESDMRLVRAEAKRLIGDGP